MLGNSTPRSSITGFLACSTLLLQLALCPKASAIDSPLILKFDSGFDDTSAVIATDASGNAFVGGAVESVDRKSEFSVLKYDSSGALRWIAKYANASHGADGGSVHSLTVDSLGNIYAVGYVYKSVTLLSINIDWLVVSYTPEGIERWSHRIDGTANARDFAGDVAVDAAGNAYVTGFIDDAVDAGRAGWTAIKYSPGGVPLWRRTDVRSDGRRDDLGKLHIDAAGNLIGSGHSSAIPFSAQHKIATTKIGPNGAVIWRQFFSDTAASDDVLADLDVDAAGNVYLTGETVSNTDPEQPHVPITLKYDAQGALLYVLRGDGAGGESVAVDPSGDIVVSGTSFLQGGNIGLAATSKYDSAGNRRWLVPNVAGRLSIDNAGNIYAFSTLVMTGTSDGADLSTTKLAGNGALAWQHRYNGKLTTTNASADRAIDSTLDAFGNFFGVGNVQEGVLDDIVTLRFAANVTPQQPPASIDAPSNLRATAASGRITLAWNDNSGNEAAFSIERCQGNNCTTFAPHVQVGANATTFVDTGLAKSTPYRYRVRAVNGSVVSAYSNIASATTPKK